MPYLTQREIRQEKGWFNVSDLCRHLNLSPYIAKQLQRSHPPEIVMGATACWTTGQVEEIKRHLERRHSPQLTLKEQKQKGGFWTVRGAARNHGICIATWRLGMDSGRVPGPTHQIGRMLHYTTEEAEAVAKYFKDRNDRPEGVLSVTEAAELLGYEMAKVWELCKDNGLGRCTGTKRWLSNADIARLVRLLGAK